MTKFIRPVTEGRITSLYGKDTLNGESRDHFGVDFAQSGTVHVMAVAAGIVSRSYTSSSYGECVRIIHQIDGKQWESLYAHMRSGSRKVKDGDRVKQGEVLGIMGNTGYSFGQHLHFELHQPTWESDKRYSVDPLKYLASDEKKGEVKVATVNIDKSKGIGFARVKVDKLNLREGPGTNFPIIRSLEQDEGFYVYEEKDGWYNLGANQWASNSEGDYMEYIPHKVDDITGHWAEESMKKAIEAKIISGYSDGSVRPNEGLTRGQFCVILDRAGILDELIKK